MPLAKFSSKPSIDIKSRVFPFARKYEARTINKIYAYTCSTYISAKRRGTILPISAHIPTNTLFRYYCGALPLPLPLPPMPPISTSAWVPSADGRLELEVLPFRWACLELAIPPELTASPISMSMGVPPRDGGLEPGAPCLCVAGDIVYSFSSKRPFLTALKGKGKLSLGWLVAPAFSCGRRP